MEVRETGIHEIEKREKHREIYNERETMRSTSETDRERDHDGSHRRVEELHSSLWFGHGGGRGRFGVNESERDDNGIRDKQTENDTGRDGDQYLCG